jgi:hypothetical protein
MSNSEERLRKEMQLFVILMKKIKERDTNTGFMTEQDKMMANGLDFVIKNAENMQQIPYGMLEEDIEMYRQNIHFVTSMLMEELGDTGISLTDEEQRIYNEVHGNEIYGALGSNDQINIDKSLPIPSINQLLDKTDAAIPMKHRLMMAIQEIDQQITPDIDSATADELLDRRLELLDELKRIS